MMEAAMPGPYVAYRRRESEGRAPLPPNLSCAKCGSPEKAIMSEKTWKKLLSTWMLNVDKVPSLLPLPAFLPSMWATPTGWL